MMILKNGMKGQNVIIMPILKNGLKNIEFSVLMGSTNGKINTSGKLKKPLERMEMGNNE